MKILFFGDSITDAGRNKEKNAQSSNSAYGCGYVMQVAGRLFEKSPVDYDIVNRGISGHRIVDLYARVKKDVWNEAPDLLSILIGINDIWHEVEVQNGVDLERFERIYRMLIEDTQKRLPDTKILLCQPFVLKGSATEEHWEEFSECSAYADVVERLAKEYDLYLLPLQPMLDEAAAKYGNDVLLRDGVHPTVQGATLIANEWMKKFEEIEKEMHK
ncbi:MAG: lysophospholipase [Clostridia bacterium]|nr:lysophospholipase [Clostridia bacterium]